MITSKLELTLVQNIDDYVHFLKKLSDNAVLELLGKKAPSQNEHKRELKELYNTTDVAVAIDDKKLESARHPLFEMLNGHPLSILLMSSLRNDMTLLEIYETLKLINTNKHGNLHKENDLAMSLSIETSLMFVKKQNHLAYSALL